MSKSLYIYGAGGMAKVVYDTALLTGWEVKAFIDDTPNAPISFMSRQILSKIPPPETTDDNFVICAIGDCDVRLAICHRLQSEGYRFATIVHPSAIISQFATIGQGVYIAAGAIIDPGACIGNFTIVNNNAVISHDTVVREACHLAPSTDIAGNCLIGDAVWLGIGTKVIEKISIGDRAYIGAGSVVVKNIPENRLAYGVPAREVKTRKSFASTKEVNEYHCYSNRFNVR